MHHIKLLSGKATYITAVEIVAKLFPCSIKLSHFLNTPVSCFLIRFLKLFLSSQN